MLQISFIRKNKKKILLGLKKRNFQRLYLIDEILILDQEKKKIQSFLNKILEQENCITKKIGKYFSEQNGYNDNVDNFKQQCYKLKNEKKKISIQLKKIFLQLQEKLNQVPNIPDEKVNKFSVENDIIFHEKNIYSYVKKNENILTHWELSKKFCLFDLKLGSEICGAGFPVYINQCAKLQRSLIQYFLDQNIQASYQEYNLPYVINEQSGFCTGQIPDKENQMYLIEKDNFYLIPTGEIPLMNCYRNKTLLESHLPIKATTYTSCFRREAGSYGSKVRGLNRLHQFDKVEIIQITTSELSSFSLEEMVFHVKKMLHSLELPFRILRLNATDLSPTSSITYDFEVYSIAQKKWMEVSSVSNCTDFQSNRLKLKYKNYKGKIKYCHTLNGSALAVPRILSTLLENNQSNNKILIPKVLIPYTGFDYIK
ncbi:serine--tRNA ligase [Blattabacterium cuenoti]|uniref:serine--tRNA ligase n=1 Tax=Blattabacterium cuenoti TaxID=1653831 RepID=UPI00163C5F10|nr:serine--tRNA ligase [Blattabacterium cuenoti]